MLRKDHKRTRTNKSCILLNSAMEPTERTLSSYLPESSLSIAVSQSTKNAVSKKDPNYEYGIRRYEELSFEIRDKVTTELGLIGEKYQGLNKNIQGCIKFKAKLEQKERKLLNMEQELSEKRFMLKKVAEKCKKMCGDNVDYHKKFEQIKEIEEQLKKKEEKLENKEEALKGEIKEYECKIKEIEQKIAEHNEFLKSLAEKRCTKEHELTKFQAEFERDMEKLMSKMSEIRSKENVVKIEEQEIAQREAQIRIENEQIAAKMEHISQLAEEYGAKEKKIFESFNEIKSKHFKTFGKNKVLLMKEQELNLVAAKLEQQQKEATAKSAALENKCRIAEKSKAGLINKEEILKEREQNLEHKRARLIELAENNKRKQEELAIKEAMIANKENEEEQLQIKVLGLEMSAQALKRKQELQKRCIENEKLKLKAKEDKLKQKEDMLMAGGYKKIRPKLVTNPNNYPK